ncbi:MAG: FHA domain-containing protein, partial [Woeseiaceae bacterium]
IESLSTDLNNERSKRRWAEDSGHAQTTKIELLESQYDESRSSLATVQQYLEGRKDRWQKQDAELKAGQRSLKEQRKEIARLGREARVAAERLRKAQATGQKFRTERDILQSDLEQVRAEARELNKGLAQNQESQRTLEARITTLTGQLDEGASALEQEQAHRQKFELELAETQQQLHLLRAELTAMQAASAEKAALIAEQQQKIDGAAPALEQAKVDREAAELELAERQQQVRSLQAELEAIQAASAEKEALIAEKQSRIDNDARAFDEEKARRQDIETELAERQERIISMHAELTAIRAASSEKESLIAERQQTIDDLSRQVESAAAQLAREESRGKDFEQQLEQLQAEAQQLRRNLADLSEEAAGHEQLASKRGEDVIWLNRELETVSGKLEGEQSDHQALVLKYETLQDETTHLRAELEPLRDTAAKAESLAKAHAELSGLLSGNENAIRDLKIQLSKTESYADGLRVKLQEHLATSDAISSQRNEARTSLATALEQVNELAARLDAEQQLTLRLKEQYADSERRFEEEIDKITFELSAAEESIAESRSRNEQLTADLAESRSLRGVMESQLEEADESRNREIRELSKQLVQLKQQIDDYDRKLNNKDAAINALLTELAHKPDLSESLSADVVHRLPDRKPHEERTGHEKERVTRLLVGSIDGQELRFPLFKDKLTIGRTVHNDIQLKAQYVSRRHAVVVTDGDFTRIVDWGSKNGIYVNGKRVAEQSLKNGDRVTVGTAEFKFEERAKR